MSTRA